MASEPGGVNWTTVHSVTRGVLPSSVGWLALAILALVVVGVSITADVSAGVAAAWVALAVVLALWLGSPSASLRDRAAAARRSISAD